MEIILLSVQNNEIVVMKFGGSCIDCAESFKFSLQIIENYLKNKMVIVTSAVKGITDKLLELYKKASLKDIDYSETLNEINETHFELINENFETDSAEYLDALNFLKQNLNEITELSKVVRLIKPNRALQDLFVSYGEKLSTYIFSKYLKSKKYDAQFLSSDEIIVTDDNFGNALPILDLCTEKVQEKLNTILKSEKKIIINITGYYGATKDGKITTLGRGGTDFTASIIAYCLKPKFNCRVIFWKDVQGLLSADPKIEKRAKILTSISYSEAKELAFFGTKILHPLSLDPLERMDIDSEIRNYTDPFAEKYTKISKEIKKDEKIIKAISSLYNLSMITIESSSMIALPGTAAKLFNIMGKNNINVKFISQSSSENNITFVVDMEDSQRLSLLLRNSDFFGKHWFSIKIDNQVSLVAIVGAGMLHSPGIAGKIFTTLGNNNINVRAIAQGSSELNISFIIERKDCERAINVLYDVFINES